MGPPASRRVSTVCGIPAASLATSVNLLPPLVRRTYAATCTIVRAGIYDRPLPAELSPSVGFPLPAELPASCGASAISL
ncbi:MAG: hypothetical protein IKL99_06245 [Oscillospiraceae bacterium]|nr:hypothetical protein [Oscillospiraceae bacterium]